MNTRLKSNSSGLFLFFVITMVGFSSGLALAEQGHGDFWFITPEEAAMAPAVIDPHAIRERGLFSSEPELSENGPKIRLEKPHGDDPQPSPVEIHIQFIPRDAPVDLSTLEVTLVKIIDIDLTERVKDYATDTGLHIKDANLPSGEHTVRVTLGDTEGGLTVTQFNVKIM